MTSATLLFDGHPHQDLLATLNPAGIPDAPRFAVPIHTACDKHPSDWVLFVRINNGVWEAQS